MLDVRAKDEGSIYWRRDSGRFTAAVTMANGSRPTLTCPHRHKPLRGRPRECAEVRAQLAELIRLRDARAPADGHRLTLGLYLQRWLEDVRPNLAPATWRKHESICRSGLIPRLGTRRLSDLSVADVRHYLHDERGPDARLGAQSLRHHRATLRRAMADALRDGLVTRNVAALAEPPKMQTAERTYLDAAQCRALIEGTRDDRLHAFWVLAVTTGMREAEMLGLTWEDIQWNAGTSTGANELSTNAPNSARDRDASNAGHSLTVTPAPTIEPPTRGHAGIATTPILASVHIRQTLQRCDGRCDEHECNGRWQLRPPKTDKSRRTVQLPALTVAALRAHRTRQLEERAKAGKLGPDGLVFTTTTGRPIHGTNLIPELRGHLDRLGLPRVTIHDLRHSCATVLYSLGVPLPAIADILGHSSIRVTADLYRHRVPELSRDAADRLESAFA